MLIESALWNEINIAQTGRKLGINSDARYRFERGVDPAFMVPGLEMATRLVMELCGGTPSENVVVGKAFGDDRVIDFPLTEVKRLAGIDVPLPEMKRILGHLGFMVAGSGPVVKVAVPSWRSDVHGKADIVEEIVRIVGVDKVPMTPFERGDAPRKPILKPIQLRTRRAKRALAARGMVEAVTWSFISKPHAELFGGGKQRTRARQSHRVRSVRHAAEPAAGPGRRGAGQCRSRLSGCRAVRSRPGVQGRQAGRSTDRGMPACATALRPRKGIGRHWSGSATADALDAKADAFAVLAAAGAPMQALQIVPGGASWLHPGRSGTIQIGPQNVLGYFGELHPRTLEALGADGPLIGVRGDPRPHSRRQAEADPRQAGARTLGVPAGVARLCLHRRSQRQGRRYRARGARRRQEADHGVTVFDVYEGKGIDDGKKSVAIAVTIQPREKTLTDQEIEAVAAKIVAEVNKKTGGVLR